MIQRKTQIQDEQALGQRHMHTLQLCCFPGDNTNDTPKRKNTNMSLYVKNEKRGTNPKDDKTGWQQM